MQVDQSLYASLWSEYNQAFNQHKQSKQTAQAFTMQFVQDLIHRFGWDERLVAFGQFGSVFEDYSTAMSSNKPLLAALADENQWEFWLSFKLTRINSMYPFDAEPFNLLVQFKLTQEPQEPQAFQVSISTKGLGRKTVTIKDQQNAEFNELCEFLSAAMLGRIRNGVCWELDKQGEEKLILI